MSAIHCNLLSMQLDGCKPFTQMKTEHLFVFHRLLAYHYVIVIHNVQCSNNAEIQGEDRQIYVHDADLS